jgi:hypothetical protein
VLVKPADLVHFNDIPLSQELQQSKSLLVPPQTVTQAADPSSSLLAKEQGEASVAEIPSTASSSSFSSSTRKTARVKTTVPDAPGAPTKQARAPTKDESSSMESIPYGYISNDVNRPPIRDPLCGECRITVIQKRRSTCGSAINALMKQRNVSLVDAASMVVEKYPTQCERCRPDACSEADKMYWRFDQASPKIKYARTHMLSSIPFERRLPVQAVQDWEGFFSNPNNTLDKRKYLYEFNPSIVILPDGQIPDIPGESPVYLASYKIASSQLCMTSAQKSLTNPKKVQTNAEDYLGLALLRSDLSVIQDAVMDLKSTGLSASDYRLFALKDQLYITGANLIAPVWLKLPTPLPEREKDIKVLYDMFKKKKSGLSLAVRTFTSCCKSEKCQGKNFNYFLGANDTIMVEVNPVFPHTVEEVDLTKRCRRARLAKGNDTAISTKGPKYPSFHSSVERYLGQREVYDLQVSRQRGTACCGKVQVPDVSTGAVKDFLVGISHQKIYKRKKDPRANVEYSDKTYTSNFYAFEPTPPYRVVAMSGKLCFSFSSDEESKENHYGNLTRAKPLVIGEEFDCPLIQFASGITEKAGDPSTMILGYGINDCTPRFVEIDKSEIIRLIFHPSGSIDLASASTS